MIYLLTMWIDSYQSLGDIWSLENSYKGINTILMETETQKKSK